MTDISELREGDQIDATIRMRMDGDGYFTDSAGGVYHSGYLSEVKAVIARPEIVSYVGAEQMTVGQMIAALNGFGELPVVLESGNAPGDLGSYRGYYEDLAIEQGEPGGRHAKPLTAGEFAVALDRVDVMTGYKGGTYSVGYGTAVWVSEYGSCSGQYVNGVVARDGQCVITTGQEEW